MRSKARILLINPCWRGIKKQKQPQFRRIWQPLDLAIAAALLEKEGFQVQILDNNIQRLSSKKIGLMSMDFNKIFVTSTPYDRWQCPSLDISFFFDTIRHIPSKRLYIMGAHVSERPEAILKASGARAAILHEPEQTIRELAHRDLSDDIPDDIPGIAYLKEGNLVRPPPRNYLNNLDQLPYPAFHLLQMDKYYYEFMGKNFTIMESSRGCPYRCSFCYLEMYGTRFRQKSLKHFLDEITHVVENFNIKNIYFMDLEFGLNRDFVLNFCQALVSQKIHISWSCQTRVTDVDREVLTWMKKSGCSLIHFGIEAGSDHVLNAIGKNIRQHDCIRAISLAHDIGIRTAVFVNFGFPGETEDDMEASINLAIRLNPTFAAFHLIVPFPGTRLAKEIGLEAESFPANQYPHYNFISHDIKSLKRILRKAYLRFYFRPSYLPRFLWNQRGQFLNLAKILFRVSLQ